MLRSLVSTFLKPSFASYRAIFLPPSSSFFLWSSSLPRLFSTTGGGGKPYADLDDFSNFNYNPHENLSEREQIEVRKLNGLSMDLRKLTNQGLFGEALPLAKQIANEVKKLLGDNHPTYASNLSNLGFVYKNLGMSDEALETYHQAIDIYAELGPGQFGYFQTLSNLGVLYLDLAVKARDRREKRRMEGLAEEEQGGGGEGGGQSVVQLLDSASDAFNMVMSLKQQYMRDSHYEIALTLSHLARVAGERGEVESAVDLFDEALLKARSHGTKEGRVAYGTILNNKGLFYKRIAGDFQKAEECYRDAIDVRESVLGRDNHETIVSLHNLSELLLLQGGEKAEEAKFLKEEIQFRMEALVARAQEERSKEEMPSTERRRDSAGGKNKGGVSGSAAKPSAFNANYDEFGRVIRKNETGGKQPPHKKGRKGKKAAGKQEIPKTKVDDVEVL